jgi:hypothetical protein
LVAVWLDVEVIPNTELLLDVERGVQCKELPMRHNANSVRKFISLFEVL